MLSLPDVTLVCADCHEVNRAIVAVERSRALCEFGAVRLLTSIDTPYPHIKIRALTSINDYSAFCLKLLHEFIPTSHMLIVQHDGWVLNPAAWDPAWLAYDYIGPLFEQEQVVTPDTVGSGGFSLRSKRLMAAVSSLCPPWDGRASYDGHDDRNSWGHEDGVVCKHLRRPLLARGFTFAPPEVAARFAFGRSKHLPCLTSFGFHGYCPELEARGFDSVGTQAAAEVVRMHHAAGGGLPLPETIFLGRATA